MDTYPEFLELYVLFFYHSEEAFEVIMVEENVDRNTPDWGIYHFFKDVHIGENIHCDSYDLDIKKRENIIETSVFEDFWAFNSWHSLI